MTTQERDELLVRVEKALIGDPEMGHKGIVNRLAEVEEYIEKDKDLKKKVTGGVIVLSFVGSAAVSMVVWIVNKLWY
jgi:hypothetical protein